MPLAPQSDPAYQRAKWRALLAVMCCYLFYYTGRQTFGFAIPGIQAELGLDKQALGWISASMLWTYAIGQVINGNLGDHFGGRRMMCAGAAASFALNWATSMAVGFKSLSFTWGANGYAQSMGWAPGSRLVANWWGEHERGKAFGLYVLAAGMSSVLSFATSLVVLDVLKLDWRWIFRLPVVLMLLGGLVVWLLADDRPSDAGFAEFDEDDRPAIADKSPSHPNKETAWQRYAAVFSSGPLLLAGLAIGFQNMVRYGLLIWVPVYFLGDDFKDHPGGRWVSIALPVGMTAGAVASGWISDCFCGSRRSGVIASFMGLAAAATMTMYFLPKNHVLCLPMLCLSGFFAYGPQSTFWALIPDLLGRARAGTAVGAMNFFAYAMAGLGEPLIGWTIERNPLSPSSGVENVALVFPMVACFALCSATLALGIRR